MSNKRIIPSQRISGSKTISSPKISSIKIKPIVGASMLAFLLLSLSTAQASPALGLRDELRGEQGTRLERELRLSLADSNDLLLRRELSLRGGALLDRLDNTLLLSGLRADDLLRDPRRETRLNRGERALRLARLSA